MFQLPASVAASAFTRFCQYELYIRTHMYDWSMYICLYIYTHIVYTYYIDHCTNYIKHRNWSRKSDFGASDATVVKASISRVRRSEKALLPMSKEMGGSTNRIRATPESWMSFIMEIYGKSDLKLDDLKVRRYPPWIGNLQIWEKSERKWQGQRIGFHRIPLDHFGSPCESLNKSDWMKVGPLWASVEVLDPGWDGKGTRVPSYQLKLYKLQRRLRDV